MNVIMEPNGFSQGKLDRHIRVGRAAAQALRGRLLRSIQTKMIFTALFVVVMALAGCGTPGGSSSGGSLKTYTSQDGKFSISYPDSWQVSSDQSGVEFTGPANHEDFKVSKYSDNGLGPSDIINQLCSIPGAASLTTSISSVTIGGQQWSRAECEFSNTTIHQMIEATTYQGSDFVITYESLDAAFASDQSNYYLPMQQRFKFMS